MEIAPGAAVDLIFDEDLLKERIDVRRSLIYDVEEDRYTLSQTMPPVRISDAGKHVILTCLFRRGSQLTREGFSGVLVQTISEYRLNAVARPVRAFILKKTSEVEAYNLRMHYRVRPDREWAKRVKFDSLNASLIDISIGGALFSHTGKKGLDFGTSIHVTYQTPDGKDYTIPAKIKRLWHPGEQQDPNLEWVAVQFVMMDMELKRELGREIMEIQRSSRVKG